ncbi:MAG TPA: glycine cleavage T C-terminal barrel domain-containing protein [Bryobacteraceae bacterium]|nr:glycine cleavage T C-terminal barrel domain-containing protein [Bryobacteraceae bacterium]
MAWHVMDVLDVSTLSTNATATAGYSALREHAAWLDLSGRGKIRANGEDRARLLHAMTTNQVETLQPGEGCYAFFLSAQGRILADVNLLCFEDHFLLDTEPETRTKVYEHLDRYIIADDVTLEDQTDRIATIAVEGPEAGAALAKLGAPQPAAPHASAPWSDGNIVGTIARLDTTGRGGFFLLIPVEDKQALISRLTEAGIPEATAEDARVVRIESGRPRYGEEITERYLVQETDQLRAVHFSKGCYLGQEIVERVRSRAQIHRVLRRLEIDTSEPPAAGTKLKSGDADAAEIASAVFSPALGKTVALAYVRMPFAEPGTAISLDGTSGRVV